MNTFFQKYKMHLILILIIILLMGWSALREQRIKRDAQRLAVLEEKVSQAMFDREDFARQLKKLRSGYDSLQIVKQGIESDLSKKKTELYWLRVKHKQEIDSLTKTDIPIDSLYHSTILIYPNYEDGKLEYPFSGSQVRQIYTTGITFPRLKEEYEQINVLMNTCTSLNSKYQLSEANLKDQISIMKRDAGTTADQMSWQKDQIEILNKTVKRKTFWQYAIGLAGATGWIVAAFK